MKTVSQKDVNGKTTADKTVPLVILELLPASKIITILPLRNNLFHICGKQAGEGEVVQNKQQQQKNPNLLKKQSLHNSKDIL